MIIDYELDSLRPSQERRLSNLIVDQDERLKFLAKLEDYLTERLRGGEAERDYVRSLATRISALGIWESISNQEFLKIALRSDSDRLGAFLGGVPKEVSDVFHKEVARRKALAKKEQAVSYRKVVETPYLPAKPPVRSSKTAMVEGSGGKRAQLISMYAEDLKVKFNTKPDMTLLRDITVSCGVSIYQNDGAITLSSDSSELEEVKNRFLVSTLGLKDSPELMDSINTVIESYGRSKGAKYRAVVYYLLAKRFKKASRFKKLARLHVPVMPDS